MNESFIDLVLRKKELKKYSIEGLRCPLCGEEWVKGECDPVFNFHKRSGCYFYMDDEMIRFSWEDKIFHFYYERMGSLFMRHRNAVTKSESGQIIVPLGKMNSLKEVIDFSKRVTENLLFL